MLTRSMTPPPREPPVTTDDLTMTLRAAGLRATPQRRAILAAFRSRTVEHLTAEEVYERARAELPELARATVYNTLPELVRAGMLQTYGRGEPVRYEPDDGQDHQHFRCRACNVLYDVHPATSPTPALLEEGFAIERTDLLLEGTCADCAALARQIDLSTREGPISRVLRAPGHVGPVDYATLDSPLGSLLAARTTQGLVSLTFDADASLRELAERVWPDVREALARFDDLRRQLEEYFAGQRRRFDLELDLSLSGPVGRPVHELVARVPYGQTLDWGELRRRVDPAVAASARGEALGANQLAILVPCHRVIRADGRLGGYVGGEERKATLLRMEGARR